MASISDMILTQLEELKMKDFKGFKSFLTSNWAQDFDSIPCSKLENTNQQEVVKLMVDQYDESDAGNITVKVLKKMKQNKLARDLEKKLKEKSDKEPGAPQKKRPRHDNEDETDGNFTGFPDLKMISTYSKLESWVSTPETSQKLISDLERKLGVEGMEALKEQLKDKEPKKTLWFNACSIDEIRKNKELDRFLSATKSTKIPKLTFSMFFKKRGSASSGNKAQSFTDFDESMDTTGELSSSGYESLLSSSFKDGYFQPDVDHSPKNKRLLDEDFCTMFSSTEDTDIMIHEKEDCDKQSKTTEQLYSRSFVQMHHETKADAPLQKGTDAQDKYINEMEEQAQTSDVQMHEGESIPNKATPLEDTGGDTDMPAYIHEMKEQTQDSNVPNIPRQRGVPLQQTDQLTKNEMPLEDESGSRDMQDKHVDEMAEEPQGSNVPYVPRNGAISLGQNDPNTKRASQLQDVLGSTDTEDANTDEMEEQSQRSYVLRPQDESITKQSIPLEGTRGSMDMQETSIHEMKEQPQGSNVPNTPRNGDVSMCQNDPITKGATQLQDVLGSTDTQDSNIDEMEKQSQTSTHKDESITKKATALLDTCGNIEMQGAYIHEMIEQPKGSNVPNIPRDRDISVCQNDPIIKRATQLQDVLGSMEVQDTYTDKMDDGPQRSNVPVHEGESITEKATPLEDTCRDTDMQEAYIQDMKAQPQGSNVPNTPRNVGVSLQPFEQFSKKDHLPPNDKRLPYEDICTVFGPTEDTDVIQENEDSDTESKTPKDVHDVSFVQIHHETKADEPLQKGTQDKYSDEREEQSQTVQMHEDESIPNKATLLEDTGGDTDMQEEYIQEMTAQPKGSNVPNIPRNRDISVCQNDPIIKRATQLHDVLGSMEVQDTYTDKMDDGPQRSNVPVHEGESITEKATPLEDTCRDTDMQEAYIQDMKAQPQGSNVPNTPRNVGVSLQPFEQFSKKDHLPPNDKRLPHEDICTVFGPTEDTDVIQENEDSDTESKTPKDVHNGSFVQIHHETKADEPLQKGTQDKYSDEQEEQSQTVQMHEDESIPNKATLLEDTGGDTDMQEEYIHEMIEQPQGSKVPNVPMQGSELSKQQQKNSPGSASQFSHSNGTEIITQNKAPNRKKDPIEAAKKREKSKHQKEKKKKEKDQLLRDWAERQCKDIGKEEFISQILFKSLAEHSDFPCFTAEDVMVYKHLTPESQIIFITDDTSINTMTMVHYCMFVCKINKAILLGPKEPTEQEIPYSESKVPLDKCKDFIFKVFAPVLTLYKQIYKEEKLQLLIGVQ